MTPIVHVLSEGEWAAAQPLGSIRTEALFLHCCTESQLDGVLARYFGGRDDLVVVRVDPTLLDDVRWEPPENPIDEAHAAERFPHVYGAIPLSAVRAHLRR